MSRVRALLVIVAGELQLLAASTGPVTELTGLLVTAGMVVIGLGVANLIVSDAVEARRGFFA